MLIQVHEPTKIDGITTLSKHRYHNHNIGNYYSYYKAVTSYNISMHNYLKTMTAYMEKALQNYVVL